MKDSTFDEQLSRTRRICANYQLASRNHSQLTKSNDSQSKFEGMQRFFILGYSKLEPLWPDENVEIKINGILQNEDILPTSDKIRLENSKKNLSIFKPIKTKIAKSSMGRSKPISGTLAQSSKKNSTMRKIIRDLNLELQNSHEEVSEVRMNISKCQVSR